MPGVSIERRQHTRCSRVGMFVIPSRPDGVVYCDICRRFCYADEFRECPWPQPPSSSSSPPAPGTSDVSGDSRR